MVRLSAVILEMLIFFYCPTTSILNFIFVRQSSGRWYHNPLPKYVCGDWKNLKKGSHKYYLESPYRFSSNRLDCLGRVIHNYYLAFLDFLYIFWRFQADHSSTYIIYIKSMYFLLIKLSGNKLSKIVFFCIISPGIFKYFVDSLLISLHHLFHDIFCLVWGFKFDSIFFILVAIFIWVSFSFVIGSDVFELLFDLNSIVSYLFVFFVCGL